MVCLSREGILKGCWICLSVAEVSLVAVVSTWQTDIGNWLPPPPNANWSPSAPQNAGDVAIFNQATFPNTAIGANNIALATTITLGEVRFDKATLAAGFLRSDLFAFDSGIPNTPAQINVTSGRLALDRFSGGASSIDLISPLIAHASPGSFLDIKSPLTGSAPFTFNGVGGFGTLEFFSFNVNASLYTLNAGDILFGHPGGPTFPGDLLVTLGAEASNQPNGYLTNQFATTSNIYLVNGKLRLNFSDVQSANTLTISQGGDADGDSIPTQKLTLNNATTALRMKGGTFSVANLALSNGGAIAYDTSLPGEGVAIMGDPTLLSTIDLNGHTVELNIDRGSDSCALFDMKMINEQFLNGGALVKNKAGTLLLEGTSSLPSLTINEGRVVLGSCLSDSVTFTNNGTLQINPQGSLGGSARIFLGSNTFLHNLGSIEPGSSACVGELTINGNYLQAAEGTLRIKIRDGMADALIVNEGGVCLNGTLCVDAAGCLSDCDSFAILDNRLGSGISGSFACITEKGIPSSLFMTLFQEPKVLFLELIPSPASQLSGRALAQMNLVNEHTLNLLDRLQAVRYRFDATQPRGASSTPNAVTLRASRGREEFVMRGDLPPLYVENPNKPASLYIAPLGTWGESDGTECIEGFDFHSVGGLIGADYAWERAGLGALLGYESLHGDIDQSIGDFQIHSLFLQGYTTFLPTENPHWFVDLIASASRNWQHLHRSHFGDVTAKPDGWEYDGYIGTGYNIDLCNRWRLTPLVAMQYVHVEVDSFHEENCCGDALFFEEENFHTWRSWAGLSFEGKWEKANTIWMPELVGYWQYQFNTRHTLDVATCNIPCAREVEVFTGEHNLGIVGARLRTLFGESKDWSLAAAYHYFWGKRLSMNALYLEAGWNF